MFSAHLFPLFPFCLFELAFPQFGDHKPKSPHRERFVLCCLLAFNGWNRGRPALKVAGRNPFTKSRTLNIIFLVFSGWSRGLHSKWLDGILSPKAVHLMSFFLCSVAGTNTYGRSHSSAASSSAFSSVPLQNQPGRGSHFNIFLAQESRPLSMFAPTEGEGAKFNGFKFNKRKYYK